MNVVKEGGHLNFMERITDKAATTVGIWAMSHDIPIVLSDIPEYLFRKEVVRNESMLELRELLVEAGKDVVLDPDINTLVPYFGAIHRYPDIMLHYNDRYTASLLDFITQNYPEFQNIAVICGYGQTKSIPTYMQFSQKSLLENLTFEDSLTQKYFGKTDQAHNMVEKLAILDHLYIHRDCDAINAYKWQDKKSNFDQRSITSNTNYPLHQLPTQMTKRGIKYIVSNELLGSTNTPEFDNDYFLYIHTKLFQNEVNKIRNDAIESARSQLKNELKRRVRDDPDLLRRLKTT